MTGTLRPSRPVLIALAVLVLLGGGLRAARAADPDLGNLSSDEIAYGTIARGITHGHYSRSLHWPPGAPVMFAVGQKLFPTKDLRAAYWLQALVGVALIGAVFVLGLLVAGPLVGLAAAGLTAIYPPYLTLAGQLLSEPLGMLLLVCGVAAVFAGWRAARLRWFAVAGLLLGATLLTRTDLLLVPGILALATALYFRGEGARRALTPAAVLLVATGLTVLPWVVFASARADHFVPITEGSGSALFVGTYLPGDGTTTGMKREIGPEIVKRSKKYRDTAPTLLPAVLVLDHVAHRRPDLDRDAALQAEGRANLRRYAWGDPLSFGAMMFHKGARMWLVSSRAGVATKSSVTRTVHFVVVLALALLLVGVGVWRRPAMVLTLGAVLAYGTLLHMVFVSKPRYALPLLPLLAVGGLAAAAALVEYAASRRSASERG